MFNIAFKIFIRSKGLLLGLLFLLMAGLIGIYSGKQFLEKQRTNIEKTIQFQKESIERNVKYNEKEIGLLLYYVRFALVNETPPIAALSMGQRDVNPSIQSVNIRNLEAQKYDTDLVNPMSLLLGNLDFGFVLIYFFPLIIIAFTYNLISEEKEEGTWALVLSQTGSPWQMLVQKFLLRYLGVCSSLLSLFFMAFWVFQLPFDEAFWGVVLLSFLYLTFWFSVGWAVVSFQENSNFNAQILLTFWVILTVIAPAIVNGTVANQYPVTETLSTVVAQREGYHTKWDKEKAPTMEKFYAHYPQFRQYTMPDKQFNWTWYYAMQQMGDDDAKHEADELKEKLRLRDKASSQIAMFLPTLHTQLIMNDLCQSSMQNHEQFLDSLTAFHEQKRLYFYPKIFTDALVKNENWAVYKVEYFREKIAVNWLILIFPFVIYSLILGLVAWFNIQKFRRNGN